MDRIRAALVGLLIAAAGVLSGAVQAGTITYYHNDLTGSPVVATNAAGQVIWRESYRPYGERTVNSAAALDNKVWFTSRRQDADTGLVYMGARYYDPVVGRFVSMDPAGFDEKNLHSFNRYAYANNNPYRYIDPDGQVPVPLIAGAIALGRAAAQRVVTFALTRGAQASVTAAEIGAGEALGAGSVAVGAAASLPFRSGDVILREYQTSKGAVELAAEAVIDGRALHLKDIAVYPKAVQRMEVGLKEVLELRKQVADEARGLGFDSLRITGTRVSGANPGKLVDTTIDLKEVK